MPTYSGLWDQQFNQPYSPLASNMNTGEFSNRDRVIIGKLLRAQPNRALGAVIAALTGTAPGATAQSLYTRRKAFPHAGITYAGGGQVPIETAVNINRATTAADAAMVTSITNFTSAPTYPVDKSGNGGGAKITSNSNYGF